MPVSPSRRWSSSGDAQRLPTERLFDAAFSNAALHWMPDQAVALASIRSVLNPGAPFVAEMGGKNNVEVVDSALVHAVEALGLPTPHIRKFFPSLAQEAVLLAEAGFEVTAMQWFERPTPLSSEQTPADWTRLFRADVVAGSRSRHGELARESMTDVKPCAARRAGSSTTGGCVSSPGRHERGFNGRVAPD